MTRIMILILLFLITNVFSFSVENYSLRYVQEKKSLALTFFWTIGREENSDNPDDRHVIQINELLRNSDKHPLFVHNSEVERTDFSSCEFDVELATVELFHNQVGLSQCDVYVKLTELVDTSLETTFSLYPKGNVEEAESVSVSLETLLSSNLTPEHNLKHFVHFNLGLSNFNILSNKIDEDIGIGPIGEHYDPNEVISNLPTSQITYKFFTTVVLTKPDYVFVSDDDIAISYTFRLDSEDYSLHNCAIDSSDGDYSPTEHGVFSFNTTRSSDIPLQCEIVSVSSFLHLDKASPLEIKYILAMGQSDILVSEGSLTSSSYANLEISEVESSAHDPDHSTYPYFYYVKLDTSVKTIFHLLNLVDKDQKLTIDPLPSSPSNPEVELFANSLSIDFTNTPVTPYTVKLCIRSDKLIQPRAIPVSIFSDSLSAVFTSVQLKNPDYPNFNTEGFQSVLARDTENRLHVVWNINNPYSHYHINLPHELQVDFSSLVSVKPDTLPIQRQYKGEVGVGVGFSGVVRGHRYLIRQVTEEEVMDGTIEYAAGNNYILSFFSVPASPHLSEVFNKDVNLSTPFPMDKLPYKDSFITLPLMLNGSIKPSNTNLPLSLRSLFITSGSPYVAGATYKYLDSHRYKHSLSVPSLVSVNNILLSTLPQSEYNSDDLLIIKDRTILTVSVGLQVATFSVAEHSYNIKLTTNRYLRFIECKADYYLTVVSVAETAMTLSLNIPSYQNLPDYSSLINFYCRLERSSASFPAPPKSTEPLNIVVKGPFEQSVSEERTFAIETTDSYEPIPYANYTDRTGDVTLKFGAPSTDSYYILVEDNFKAAIAPKTFTKIVTIDQTAYFRHGPHYLQCGPNRICILTTQLLLQMNRRYTEPVSSRVFFISESNYNLVVEGVDPDHTLDSLKVSSASFIMPPYNETSTTSLLTPTLSWKFNKKTAVQTQIDQAHSLVARGAGKPTSLVFLIDLEYSGATAPYTTLDAPYQYASISPLAAANTVSAKFGLDSVISPGELQNAINQAASENNHHLNDLSTSVIMGDIFSQCLAEGHGCGDLCAPCTGNNVCKTDFECFSGVCSFGECVTFDKKYGNSVPSTSPLSIFYLVALICSYLLL